MSSIIVSLLEQSNPRLDLTLELGGDLAGSVGSIFTAGEIDITLNLSGNFGGQVRTETSLNARLNLSGELEGTVRLALNAPPPVLNNLSAFKKSCFPRLLVNGIEAGIYSFTLDAPKNEIGKRLNVSLTNQSLLNADPAKKYTFQMNVKALPSSADDWQTILSSGDLDSRGVAVRFRGDNLSLNVVSPAEDALRLSPSSSETIYNPDKTDFDISKIEPMRTDTGAIIPYGANRQRNLDLYRILFYLQKQLGLGLVSTNVPNYELTRVDFSIMQSYRDAVAPFFGAYETLWLADGDSIQIIDKSQIVPEDHEFFELTAEPPGTAAGKDRFLSWQVEMPSLPRRDGLQIVFSNSDLEAEYYIDRTTELPPQPSSKPGKPDYQVINTTQTFREWFNSEFPDVVLRKEFIREVRTTRAPIPPYTVTLSDIGVFTTEHVYDRVGKRISSTQRHETRMPDVEDPGTILLTKTSEVRQTVSYTADPSNPRRFLPFQIVTYRDGLIAVDEDQPYISPQTGEEAPYRQEYSIMHRKGDLKFEGEMTKEFGPISQTTETLTWTGEGQYQSTSSTIYYTSGHQGDPVSEPKAGDASVSGTSAQNLSVYVYRDGFTPLTNAAGYGFETFAVGELPLKFAIPLARRRLAQRFDKKQSGVLEVGGYSDSLKRGALLKVLDRAGNSYGKFIVEGFTVTGERNERGWQITSRISVAEI